MITGHVSTGSILDRAIHAPLWISGATGFVLLAGIVIGMVQRRATNRGGTGKLFRRAKLVYLTHLGLVALALLVSAWRPGGPTSMGPVANLGGWVQASWLMVSLQLNPPLVDILSMYVILFGVAAIAAPLLRARFAWIVGSLSIAFWIVALTTGWGHLPQRPGVEALFNVAGWQALFVSGFLIGWYWRSSHLDALFNSKRVFIWTAGIACVLIGFAQLVVRGQVLKSSPLERSIDIVVAGPGMGPGDILLGWCVFAALYYLQNNSPAHRVSCLAEAVFGQVGRRSLDSFVIMTTVVIVLPAVNPYGPSKFVGMALAVGVYALAWGWAWLRDHRTHDPDFPSADFQAAGPGQGSGSPGVPRTSSGSDHAVETS